MKDNTPLRKEDYVEPRCVICDEPYGSVKEIHRVPQDRIIDKMNDYMSRRDYAGAERHLLYWLREAKLGNDLQGELLVCNELIGHFRKTSNKEQAFIYIDRALELLDIMDFHQNISAGTTYVNAATACSAFGDLERAKDLFMKAREIYESAESVKPELLGGLYNNLALVCTALEAYDEAHKLYDKAMEVMGRVKGGELEQAITCLNRADALAAEKGLENTEKEVFSLVDQAYDLLKNADAPHDGYYAFVLEKCVPSFSYYGYFLAASEFEKLSKEIYERD